MSTIEINIPPTDTPINIKITFGRKDKPTWGEDSNTTSWGEQKTWEGEQKTWAGEQKTWGGKTWGEQKTSWGPGKKRVFRGHKKKSNWNRDSVEPYQGTRKKL